MEQAAEVTPALGDYELEALLALGADLHAVRVYHQYREPVVGFCVAPVKLGRMTGTVRCSRLAVEGAYCRTHAPKS